MALNWHFPTEIVFGRGQVQQINFLCAALNITRPLIVTDQGLASSPIIKQFEIFLKLKAQIFSSVTGNPTDIQITEGVKACKENNINGVVAIGGGSALDAGKAIAFMSAQSLPLFNFEDNNDNFKKANSDGVLPIIAIPTTAGTGSEVGRCSVITDTQAQRKRIIFHPKLLPTYVILDPELTTGLPANLTAATGMDALSHNLEAYCSPSFHPMAEGIAVEGIKLIKNYLVRAVQNGNDIEAREHMLIASTMGATAFQKGLGAMHALAHTLGAMYNAHHGLLNAILMPYVLKANQAVIASKIVPIANHIELPKKNFDGFLDWVIWLRSEIDIPHSLADIGISDKDATKIAALSHSDPAASGNPISFSIEQYQQIFLNAVNGKL
ncbi:iron-containing alcohol dehydrogenase [Shewanella sp. 202IG2-18]|uniref:iron-containing alcohol dehydrogenase n=1 Tax=Parashewanella hymeniacidonis TaxID=2807618 RepID=UPI001960921F|nr:iron-containing alcohol dehydrogenase [Parashewanella hymeniacidonis]MBM7073830.1 iron-containing alcohol dehydrogenase [Parashewanella hymeniacidonis]